MYIDVVPDKVIWIVNWLHYLDYEPIACTSSPCYLVCTRNDLVSSYGWCNGIPCVVLLFDCSQNDSRMTVFLTEGKRVFHMSILSSVRLRNVFASGLLSYGQASTYHRRPTF